MFCMRTEIYAYKRRVRKSYTLPTTSASGKNVKHTRDKIDQRTERWYEDSDFTRRNC